MANNRGSEGQSETEHYCHSISGEVGLLEQLLSNDDPYGEISKPELQELWMELAAEADEEPDQYRPSVLDYVNLYCLEFVAIAERSSATKEWDIVGCRLLRTYGGPGATIEWRDSDYVIVEVSWWGESAIERIYAPNLAGALAELAEMART